MRPSFFLSVVVLLMWAGCGFFDKEDPDARIVFGESIERLKIGDDSTTVVETLGAPDVIAYGDFDGETYVYSKGVLALTEVTISRDSRLGLGVFDVRILAPYQGKTKGGTGIGTPRGMALAELGAPDTMLERSTGTLETYLFESNTFWIDYRDGIIFSMYMRTPPPNQLGTGYNSSIP